MLKINKIIRWALRFLQIQLFLSIISLPVLIWWGLPISVMTLLSNLIFGPILMIFLLLASIIFFTELFNIPNTLFIYCLERFTNWWALIMQLGSPNWLVAFAKPSPIFFIILFSVTFIILQHKKLNSPKRSSICFALLLIVATCYLKCIHKPQHVILEIPCNRGLVTYLHTESKTILIDPGVIGQRISAPKWIEYTLVPTLQQTYGITSIDHVIALQPSIMTFEALAILCSLMHIKTLYLAFWDGESPQMLLRAYGKMRYTLEEYGGELVRFDKELEIKLNKKAPIIISPLKKILRYKNITFPALHLSGIIAKKNIEIFSIKYKKEEASKTSS